MFPTAFNHKNTMHCSYDIHSSFHATLYSSHNNFPSNDFSFPLLPPPPPPQSSRRKNPPAYRRHNGIFILFHILCIFARFLMAAATMVAVVAVLSALLVRKKEIVHMHGNHKKRTILCLQSNIRKSNRIMLIFH